MNRTKRKHNGEGQTKPESRKKQAKEAKLEKKTTLKTKIDSVKQFSDLFLASEFRHKWWVHWNNNVTRKVSLDEYTPQHFFDPEDAFSMHLMSKEVAITEGFADHLPNPWDTLYDLCHELAIIYILWGVEKSKLLIDILVRDLYPTSYLAAMSGKLSEEFKSMLKDMMGNLCVDDGMDSPLGEEIDRIYGCKFFEGPPFQGELMISVDGITHLKKFLVYKDKSQNRPKKFYRVKFKWRGKNPRIQTIKFST